MAGGRAGRGSLRTDWNCTPREDCACWPVREVRSGEPCEARLKDDRSSFDFLGFTHYCRTQRNGRGSALGRKPRGEANAHAR